MENLIIEQDVSSKQKYENPKFDIIKVSSVDIVASSNDDGEWDEQTFNEN